MIDRKNGDIWFIRGSTMLKVTKKTPLKQRVKSVKSTKTNPFDAF